MFTINRDIDILTHWGRYASINWTKISSDNGLSPVRYQSIIWTNAGMLSMWPFGTNFSEIWIKTFSCGRIHLKMLSAKRRPLCLGLNVLRNMLTSRVIFLQIFTHQMIFSHHPVHILAKYTLISSRSKNKPYQPISWYTICNICSVQQWKYTNRVRRNVNQTHISELMLSHRGRKKGHHLAGDIFKSIFGHENCKCCIVIKISLKRVPKGSH